MTEREEGTEIAVAGSMAEYRAIKALSAGMIWTMDSECPFKAWLASPWNVARESVNATHFDIGTAVHLAVLEDQTFEVRTVSHDFDDYRTKEARDIRDSAWAEGKTPLKPSEQTIVAGMRAAILEHPIARKLLTKGEAESTLTWEWDGLACKCRPDYLAGDLTYVVDLKTTTTVNPRAVARKAFNDGWFLRAAWYTAGVKAARGILPDKYLFVVSEIKAPHLIEIYELDNRALLYGEQIIMRTLPRAAECLAMNKWPGYGDGQITMLSLPPWSEYQLADREEEAAA